MDMENQAGSTVGLEDRLRGLILSNSNEGHQELPSSGVARGNAQPAQPSFNHARNQHPQGPGYDGALASKTTQGAPTTHKRPNQAQRRQMAAELSIPIDIRPEQVPGWTRPHTGNAGYSGQQHHPFPAAGRGRGRPGPDTHRLSNRQENGNQQPVGSHPQYHRGGPNSQHHQVSHQQHRQTHSNSGPQTPVNAENWRQGPRQQNQWQQGRPHTPLYQPGEEQVNTQAAMLERLCVGVLVNAEISIEELTEKENFRMRLEQVCREVVIEHEFSVNGSLISPRSIELKCFGSLASGFATKAADMDLALVSPQSTTQPDAPGSPIPRLLEKALLQMGVGARLLTRTRVPIIKVCEHPTEDLRAGLLAARLKWEAGEGVDVGGPGEDQLDGEPATTTIVPDASQEEQRAAPPAKHTSSTGGGTGRQLEQLEKDDGDPASGGDEDDFGKQLKSLKQSGKHKSFNSYCGFVKTFLRKENIGFGPTQANEPTFTADMREKLGAVCYAFVCGLKDERLRTRLLGYYSLAAIHGEYRTLQGVIIQIEGEMLAKGWMERPLPEKDERQEEFARQAVEDWTRLQNKEDFHLDMVAYQGLLFQGCERLKRIPSLQLPHFQQDQFESASGYHTRAISLMAQLGGNEDWDGDATDTKVLPVMIRYYVSGIYDPDIRSAVEAFAAAESPQSLTSIATRHKSLQLARDYEKALLKGYYPNYEAEIVRRYIACLQQPLKRHDSQVGGNSPSALVVPLAKSVADEVMPVIVRLGNPANLPPNQPRDSFRDPLEFPKTGAGVQCDVNFSAQLALQNTALLRGYSYTDPRVKPMVLFVKHWAKVRGINSPYRGSLSSYGYVLMVIHYLVNVVQPFVCPNLQLLAPADDANMPADHRVCKGYDVRFWRDEETIRRLAAQGQLNKNRQSIGQLLRGFFEYYAYPGTMASCPTARGFDWSRDALSLRTPGGLVKKQAKGWTGAKTVTEVKTIAAPPGTIPTGPGVKLVDGSPATEEVREVRQRYLFAIEDPFELDHNVARTVTHSGIVSIRDEFRRAWRLIKSVGSDGKQEDLLEDSTKEEQEKNLEEFRKLGLYIHGPDLF